MPTRKPTRPAGTTTTLIQPTARFTRTGPSRLALTIRRSAARPRRSPEFPSTGEARQAKLGSNAGFVLKEPSKPDSALWRKTDVHAPAFSGASLLHPGLLHRSLCRQLRFCSNVQRQHASAAHTNGECDANRFCLCAKYLGGAARGWRGAARHELPGPDDESAFLARRKMDCL